MICFLKPISSNRRYFISDAMPLYRFPCNSLHLHKLFSVIGRMLCLNELVCSMIVYSQNVVAVVNNTNQTLVVGIVRGSRIWFDPGACLVLTLCSGPV